MPQREQDQRVATRKGGPERLAVPGPELVASPSPRHGSPQQAWEPDAGGEIEPDDNVRVAENELAEPALVRAVDHPAVGCDYICHSRAEVVGIRLGPVRLPEERVELVEGDVEAARDLAADGRATAPLADVTIATFLTEDARR